MGYVVSLHGHGGLPEQRSKPSVSNSGTSEEYQLMESSNLFERVLALKMTSHKAK